MRIVIVGSGAIGTWMGVRLAQAGNDVGLLSLGDTLQAIRRDGLRLTRDGETRTAKVTANDDPAALGQPDLIVIAVKGNALTAIAPAVTQMMGTETVVLPAINGVPWWFAHGLGGPLANTTLQSIDPDGALTKAIPPPCVIGCVVHASAYVQEPGHSVNTGGNGLIVGEPDGKGSPRLARIADVLRAAAFEVKVSSRIQQDIWYKLWGNMTMNPISALTGATGDRILGDPELEGFILAVMAEAKEIGARIGCPIAETGEDRMKITRRLGAFRTSMLQDAEAGKPLEIDPLLAAPREIAGRVGVETPNIDALHGLIRVFEGMRRSKNS
jgi:2-dehydropantoate 2-reductase